MTSTNHFWKDISSCLSSKVALAGLVVCIFFGIFYGCVYIAQGIESEFKAEVNAAGILVPEGEQDLVLANNRINQSQLPDSSFIYDVSIAELANADSYMDGQTVQVTGEVVGDRITAEEDSDYCWIVLQSLERDEEVSVFMPKSKTDMIDAYGAYGQRGTILQVRGIFYLASEQHQGASELQAQNVSVVSKGEKDVVPFRSSRMMLGIGLLAIGCVLVVVYNFLRERRR